MLANMTITTALVISTVAAFWIATMIDIYHQISEESSKRGFGFAVKVCAFILLVPLSPIFMFKKALGLLCALLGIQEEDL